MKGAGPCFRDGVMVQRTSTEGGQTMRKVSEMQRGSIGWA